MYFLGSDQNKMQQYRRGFYNVIRWTRDSLSYFQSQFFPFSRVDLDSFLVLPLVCSRVSVSLIILFETFFAISRATEHLICLPFVPLIPSSSGSMHSNSLSKPICHTYLNIDIFSRKDQTQNKAHCNVDRLANRRTLYPTLLRYSD